MSGQDVLSGSRRHRYARSSTTSVTQLLTDSCSSFIHRLTTRVRGPSQTLDNGDSSTSLRIRTRLEDKYAGTSARQRIEKKYEKHNFDGCENIMPSSDNARLSPGKSDQKCKSGLGRSARLFGDDPLKARDELYPSRRREIFSGGDKKQKTDSEDKRPSGAGLLTDDYYRPLGITRTRLEDKYSDVLDKYVKKKRDLRKADSPPESSFALKKSATTANVVLTEKAYPFVASSGTAASRDKTPFRANDPAKILPSSRQHHRIEKTLENESRSSCKKIRSLRKDESETSEKPFFRLCPVEIDADSLRHKDNRKSVRKLKEACIVDEAISEREARRKEIQSLINKYVMLDEAYCKLDKKIKSKTKEMTVKSGVALSAQIVASKRRQRVGLSINPMPVTRKINFSRKITGCLL